MGGGGVMRTAASRLVGVGTVVGGVGGVIRGSQSAPKPEYQAFSAARRPSSAIAASSEGGSALAEKASWEVDDWEFAGVEDDLSFGSGDSLPRVVFGGAPTFDEAKEATLELKAAAENTLMLEDTNLPLVLATKDSESITCVSNESASAHVVPKHAVQAFRFLSENPAAQNVVASIASDPNVWNAVIQNTAFVDYLESHKSGSTSLNADAHLNQHVGIVELQDLNFPAESETSFVGSSETIETGTSIAEILQTIKLTVLDIVNNVTNFFQDIFGVPETGKKPSEDDACSSKAAFIESTTLKASIMGLAIMVISMVVLKRA
uniref:Uncharacterized protein n=1 Tax=Kalanchoe fedtschenkoi TaxID=63787 RepID=A0A7N0UX96_KALFE